MHLVTPLVSGVRGAEYGYVHIYRRGTSSAVNWYSDFEGTTVSSSSDAIQLDSNGGAEVYVNEHADVQVYSSAGVLVREFVVGVASSGVEYQGQGFTGANYDTAASGAGSGYQTTVQAILDLALTAFGGPDWKVSVNGTNTYIGTAITGVLGVIFNVKSYGALGDGTTDDTSAIAAAISAASTAGGGFLFFPKGTYRITSTLTLTAKISVFGAGSEVSVITVDHASANGLTFTGTDTYAPRLLHGVRVTAAQVNTGTPLVIGSSTQVAVSNCYFGGTNSNGTIASVAGNTTMRNCWLTCRTGSTASMVVGSAYMRDCWLDAPATYNPTNGIVYASSLYMDTCNFRNTSCTSGTFSCIKWSSTTVAGRLRGVTFGAGGGATVTAMTLGTYAAASNFEEHGSIFGTSVTAYSYTFAAAATGSRVKLGSRDDRVYIAADNTTPLSIPTDQYGTIVIERSTNANQALNGAAVPPEGAKTIVHVSNLSGAAIAQEAFGTNFQGTTLASIAMAQNTGNDGSAMFVSIVRSGTAYMKMIGVGSYTTA
jgi:hypothetical protein